MNRRDGIDDQQIDDAARALTRGTPSADLRARVLARVARGARPTAWLWTWGTAGAAATAMIVAVRLISSSAPDAGQVLPDVTTSELVDRAVVGRVLADPPIAVDRPERRVPQDPPYETSSSPATVVVENSPLAPPPLAARELAIAPIVLETIDVDPMVIEELSIAPLPLLPAFGNGFTVQ